MGIENGIRDLKFSDPSDLLEADAENLREETRLVREGYKMFFNQVLNLPNLEAQPIKHISDYKKEDINFVTLGYDEYVVTPPSGEIGRALNILGYGNIPVRIAILNVRDDKSEKHKGVYKHSAFVVLEDVWGGIFNERIVFGLEYAYSSVSEAWYEKSMDAGLSNLSLHRKEELGNKREGEILFALNVIAKVYSQRLQAAQVPVKA